MLSLMAISQAPLDFTSGQNVAFTPAVSPSFTQAFPVLLPWADLARKENRLCGKTAPQVSAARGQAALPARDTHSEILLMWGKHFQLHLFTLHSSYNSKIILNMYS